MNRKKVNLELYKTIYLIRQTEKTIIDNYATDEMKTPMHMSMGSEAIAAGVCLALGNKNHFYGTYRSHALYLSLTKEVNNFFGEMYGKVTGTLKGKGGSMHVMAPEHGLLGVSAVVASTIPLAVGTAFANKVKANNKIVTVFFGDGAVDEGVFWESLNLACLKKLRVLFVCEDNGFAVHTPPILRRGYKDLTKIVTHFACKVFSSSSTDVEEIYKLTLKAAKFILKNNMPVFLQLKYYRYLEHVGVNEDFNMGYRDKKTYNKWKKIDPVLLQRRKLLKLGTTENQIKQIEDKIDKKILFGLRSSQKASFPKKEELYKHLFYEK